MPKELIKILTASESDMSVIEQLAQKFDLDCEDMAYEEFVIAKKKDEIIGFGRLRKYYERAESKQHCAELATVGIVPETRKNGVGSMIVKELIRSGPEEIFVTCVIPDFFRKFGFKPVKEYPDILQKKVDFCKMYDFKDEQVFVMRLIKNRIGDPENAGIGD